MVFPTRQMGCNKAWHMCCLDPALGAVPEDDWFCEDCEIDEAPLEQVVSDAHISPTYKYIVYNCSFYN